MKRQRGPAARGRGRRALSRWIGLGIAVVAASVGVYVAVPASAETSQWIAVAAGTSHTCGIKSDTTVWCWGSNNRGQLGLGHRTDTTTPTKVHEVGSSSGWSAITAGEDFTCGIRNGYLYCWGANEYGQLGLDDRSDRTLPRRNGALANNWAQVSAGRSHACGVRNNGTGQCWGQNLVGALGTGDTTDRTRPHTVAGGIIWDSITAGAHFSCGLDEDGQRYCWGASTNDELGLPDGNQPRLAPVAAPADGTWRAVESGDGTTCGISSGRRLYCWGANMYGNAGVGDTVPHDEPSRVNTTSQWASVSSGGGHACAIKTNGLLYCWGHNESGQLGIGSNLVLQKTTQTTVSINPDWSTVTAGGRHTCGIRTDNTLYCWGDNTHGQLGDGTNTLEPLPKPVA